MKVFQSIVIIVLSSCAPTISIPDTSKSIQEPLTYILSCLKENTIDSFHVEVINRFGGQYKVSSTIKKTSKSTSIETVIVDASGVESDTSLFFPNQEFEERLNFEIETAESQVKIAGSYQQIKVIKNDTTKEFLTTRGIGLLHLLRYGKSNIKKN